MLQNYNLKEKIVIYGWGLHTIKRIEENTEMNTQQNKIMEEITY